MSTASEMRDLAERVLGAEGRMMSYSKSGYSRARPRNIAIFNARVAVAREAARGEHLWSGDLDLTLWEQRLAVLARLLDRPLYLLYEADGRDSYDEEQLARAVAIFARTGTTEILERPGSAVARATDGVLRFHFPPDTRKRLRWRVLAHRPRLWRFWHIELRRGARTPGTATRSSLAYVGARSGGRSPLLVVAAGKRQEVYETFRFAELTWYLAGGEKRRAERALLRLSPRLRIRRLMVWAGLIVWPGFMYEAIVGLSWRRRYPA